MIDGAAARADLAFTNTTSPMRSISLNDRKNSSSSVSITKAILPSLDHARSLVTPSFFASPSMTSLPMTSSRRFHSTKSKNARDSTVSLKYLALLRLITDERGLGEIAIGAIDWNFRTDTKRPKDAPNAKRNGTPIRRLSVSEG